MPNLRTIPSFVKILDVLKGFSGVHTCTYMYIYMNIYVHLSIFKKLTPWYLALEVRICVWVNFLCNLNWYYFLNEGGVHLWYTITLMKSLVCLYTRLVFVFACLWICVGKKLYIFFSGTTSNRMTDSQTRAHHLSLDKI